MDTLQPECVLGKTPVNGDEMLSLWPSRGPLIKRETIKEIMARVALQHNITVDQLKGPRRLKHLVRARFQAIYEIRTITGHSYPMIAERVGGRDHTSILNAYRRYPALVEKERAKASRTGRAAVQ